MSDSGNIAAMQRELGRQLAALRREAGLTQHGLAALAGFSRTTVSLAEIGRQSQAREFWVACDKALDTGGALAAGADQIDAVRDAEQRAAASAAQEAREARARRPRCQLPGRDRVRGTLMTARQQPAGAAAIGIVPAGEADIEVLSQVIADAFFPLAPCQWLIGDEAARRDIFPAYFRMYVEHAMADGLVHTTPGRDAAALWIPLGPQLPSPPDGYDEHLAEVTGPWVERFAVFDGELDAHHLTGAEHHHLAILAVRPTGRARASAPRCSTPTMRSSTSGARRPTWRHPTSAPAASTCATAMPITAPRSSCPAARPGMVTTACQASRLTARACTRWCDAQGRTPGYPQTSPREHG
jgi:transcriptional regulator with XRE-family HTH domain